MVVGGAERRPDGGDWQCPSSVGYTTASMANLWAVRCTQRRRGALAIAGLLVLLVALAVLHASQPLHLHRGTTAGAYNEEHVLASLDSVTGDAPLPAITSEISLALVSGPGVVGPRVELASPVARYAESRAPPLG